jgi:hypothetical protein
MTIIGLSPEKGFGGDGYPDMEPQQAGKRAFSQQEDP